MSLYKKLKADQVQSRKDRDVLKAALLTTLMGEIQVSATGNGTPDYDEDGVLKVADNAVLAVIKKFIKNTNEFIRVKDNPTSRQEIEILQAYLPKQLEDEVLKALIDAYVIVAKHEGKDSGGALIGFVMKQLKEGYPDQFDASKVKAFLS